MPITPCECPAAGWCARHQREKPPAWHLLCQRKQAYFDAWERGEGPRLLVGEESSPDSGDCPESADEAAPTGPSLWQCAQNFGRAVVRHVADRARSLDDAAYEQRLAVCRQCPSCDLARMVCQERKCGCFLTVKVCWRSEHCPQDRWPEPMLDAPAENSA